MGLALRLEHNHKLYTKLILTHQIKPLHLLTIFPKAETYALSKVSFHKSISVLAPKHEMNKYRSVMDFVFCEIFPWWKQHAFNYYAGKGPLLKDEPGLTPDIIEAYDQTLKMCFMILNRIHKDLHLYQWMNIVVSSRQTHPEHLNLYPEIQRRII